MSPLFWLGLVPRLNKLNGLDTASQLANTAPRLWFSSMCYNKLKEWIPKCRSQQYSIYKLHAIYILFSIPQTIPMHISVGKLIWASIFPSLLSQCFYLSLHFSEGVGLMSMHCIASPALLQSFHQVLNTAALYCKAMCCLLLFFLCDTLSGCHFQRPDCE